LGAAQLIASALVIEVDEPTTRLGNGLLRASSLPR
jgi:hypothetical protein